MKRPYLWRPTTQRDMPLMPSTHFQTGALVLDMDQPLLQAGLTTLMLEYRLWLVGDGGSIAERIRRQAGERN